MKLSDIMGHMGLAGYAEVALAIFLFVFIGATIWAYLPSNRQRFGEAMQLPLAADAPISHPNPLAAPGESNGALATAGELHSEATR